MDQEKLAFINGFLHCVSLNNSGINYGCDYYIAKVDAKETLDETIQSEYQPFLKWLVDNKKIESADGLKINYRLIEDWSSHLRQVIHHWLFEMEFSANLSTKFQEEWMEERLFQLLNEFLSGEVQVWEVFGGSYDIEFAEYLLKDQNGYYLLHFGWSE